MTIYMTTVASPLGDLMIAAHESAVCALEFADEWPAAERRLHRLRVVDAVERGDPTDAIRLLTAYFAGDLSALSRLAIDAKGTPFQLRTWSVLRQIRAGTTMTYAELARRVGCPRGHRAVGGANRLNPLAIAIPCHRVVGVTGALRGYAGGVDRKRWLLSHEARHASTDVPPPPTV
jgi:methylated-DNA-[protein]-cysteine S-methyltransferase